MKDTQDKIGYCQLSLGLLYEDSTEYDNNGEVYPVSKQEISHMKNTNRFVVHGKLLEAIVEDANIEKAIQRVVSNKGSGGVVLNAKLNKKKNKENSQNKRKSLIKVNE